MLDLFIIISKYLNILYISLFLLIGWLYIVNERDMVYIRGNHNRRQFLMILLMIINCGIIITFSKLNITDINTFLFFIAVTIVIVTAKVVLSTVFKNSCPLLWNGILFLISIGLIIIYRLNPYMAYKQLIFAVFGFVVISFIPLFFKLIPRIEYLTYVYLVLCMGLIFLPFIYQNEISGSLNWVSMEIANKTIRFQPSEIAKLLYIFFIATLFRKEVVPFRKMIIAIIFSSVIVFTLVIQKDLGTALVYFMTFISVFLVGTNSYFLVAIAIVSAILVSKVAYDVFYHVQVRVDTWLDPFSYAQTGGYQVLQSWFSMGTYGLLGSGIGNGYPEYVPVVESDFIYSAIAEEMGGMFAILMIFVYIMIFYRMINISLRSEEKFHSLIVVGITGLLYFQTMLIIGGVTGFIPLTGVTLPFVSAGGSSLFISIVMIGIVQWINNKSYVEDYEDDEYDYEEYDGEYYE